MTEHGLPIGLSPVPQSEVDPDTSVHPEAYTLENDNFGVVVALSLLSPDQRNVLCQKTGLNEHGESLSTEETALHLKLSIPRVRTLYGEAVTRLRGTANILDIIQGETMPVAEAITMQARFDRDSLVRHMESGESLLDYALRTAAQDTSQHV